MNETFKGLLCPAWGVNEKGVVYKNHLYSWEEIGTITAMEQFLNPTIGQNGVFQVVLGGKMKNLAFPYKDKDRGIMALAYIKAKVSESFPEDKEALENAYINKFWSMIASGKMSYVTKGEILYIFYLLKEKYGMELNYDVEYEKVGHAMAEGYRSLPNEIKDSLSSARQAIEGSSGTQSKDRSVVKDAVVGGIIAGPAGAVVGAIHAADKNAANRSSGTNSGSRSVVKDAVVGGIIAGPAGAVVGAIHAADKNAANRSNDTNSES